MNSPIGQAPLSNKYYCGQESNVHQEKNSVDTEILNSVCLKMCDTGDSLYEIAQAMKKLPAIAREIFVLLEQEVPTMRKS